MKNKLNKKEIVKNGNIINIEQDRWDEDSDLFVQHVTIDYRGKIYLISGEAIEGDDPLSSSIYDNDKEPQEVF